MQHPGPSPMHSDATGRGLEGRGSLSFWEGDTPCAHAGPMHKAGKGAEATRGACILSLTARQQAWGHGVPALGTDSTQGDRGVNDSFRHLHPSGDCSGGKSTRMTCVRSRSTEKGEMEKRRDEERDRPKHRERHRGPRCGHMAACPLSARTSHWSGLLRTGPSPIKDVFSQPPPLRRGPRNYLSPNECGSKPLQAGTLKQHRGFCGLESGQAHTDRSLNSLLTGNTHTDLLVRKRFVSCHLH